MTDQPQRGETMISPALHFMLHSDGSDGIYYVTASANGHDTKAPGVSPQDAYVAALTPLIPVTEGALRHEIERIVWNMQSGCLSHVNRGKIDYERLRDSHDRLKPGKPRSQNPAVA